MRLYPVLATPVGQPPDFVHPEEGQQRPSVRKDHNSYRVEPLLSSNRTLHRQADHPLTVFRKERQRERAEIDRNRSD